METINRSLGSFERMSWLIDQTRCSHFALAAHIKGDATVSQWQSALDSLQARHPILSMGINSEDIYKPFFFASIRQIPLRVIEQADAERWEREMEEELSLPFDHRQAPLLRAVLVENKQNTVIILSAHHAIADGIALSFLMRDLIMALSGIPCKNWPCLNLRILCL